MAGKRARSSVAAAILGGIVCCANAREGIGNDILSIHPVRAYSMSTLSGLELTILRLSVLYLSCWTC